MNSQKIYSGFLSGIGVKSGREATILVLLVLFVGAVAAYAFTLVVENRPKSGEPKLSSSAVSVPSTQLENTPEATTTTSDQSLVAYESGRAAEFTGDFPRAYEAYRQAIGDSSLTDENAIDLYVERMRAYARMARATARFGEAEAALKTTIEVIGGNRSGGDLKPSILIASLTGELADISLKRKNYVAAANYAQEVVKASRSDVNTEATQSEQAIAITIAALDTLSKAQKASGNLSDAIAASEHALTLTKQSVGPLSPSVGLRLERLAVLFDEFKAPLKGLSLRGQALAIAEVDKNISRDELIINLNNLAEAYRHLGKLDQAKPLYKKAIKIAKNAHGANAAEAAVPLNNLGLIAQWSGDENEAEEYYMKALTTIWDSMGPDHDITQRVLANMVRLLESQGRAQDISILKTKYGPS